ncbi:MAG: 4Fe-4S binding protein [Anaerolineales bacterium]|nr:4Fe-4S binding protein [Anaerolineales bacterium]
MDLISTAERLAAIDRSAVTFHQERCLHSRDKYANCEQCLGLCPLEAIQSGKPPSLETKLCVNCLACLPVCPTGAYSADDALPALLNCAARADAKKVELVCELHPHAELGIPGIDLGLQIRGCLAGLGLGAYLALISLGFEQVIARTDVCQECPFGAVKPHIEAQIVSAKRLLEPWDWAGRLSTPMEDDFTAERPLWDAENPPLSRRDLFRLASRQSQLAAARIIAKDEGEAGKRPPRERRRVISAMQHLPDMEKDANLNLEKLGFAFLSVSTECSACKACARACPSGCLQTHQNEESHFTLEFTPQACTGCGICAHVCAPGAITIDRSPTFEQVFGSQEAVTLIEADLIRCQRCNASFFSAGGNRLCPPCEFRRQNPFGSRLPPGFKVNK